jgi:hypothetical protein
MHARSRGGDRLIIRVYVNDLIITGITTPAIDEFKQEKKEKSQMSDLGLLSYYLGIEVIQGEAGIALYQSAYTGKLLKRCGLSSCNSAEAPMENMLKLSKESTKVPVDAIEYHNIVGALRYLLHTHLELTFAVEYLSCFIEEPHGDHLITVKRVLRYIAGTQDLGLFYTKQEKGPPKLIGFSDADLGEDIVTRRSTSGVVLFLGVNPINWQSSKQKVVALSSCEVEYMATVAAAC